MFARTVWAPIGKALGKPEWTPSQHDSLAEWAVDKRGSNNVSTKDLRTIFALTWWEVWKYMNAIVFEGARPSVEQLLRSMCAEGSSWSTAGELRGEVMPFFARVERWVSDED